MPVKPRHAFLPRSRDLGDGTIACSVEAIRLSRELARDGQPEAVVVVTVVRVVVVPIRGAAVLRVVEVAAATKDTVVALSAMDPVL